ncbi:MAG: ComEA family DNA-binding protein [Parabacteroides sp.]|nr:helix-hairpin-helix domain-containing protein [Parabacteroides sp.]MCI7783422.1 helix-hairpin-helix domain-containing protein [Parabacteroides sp.]MDD6080302.1 helix-hairpin-helix domain-containing protein [bacterium]MDD7061552.1 helix-hairpin-helix domain-containing protein [bacterium]MDY4756937.1 helix-hairpin-helix domain-containing protein [Parabacteroides sp.]
MQLKDLCYFSKGERNALLVLLCLIALTWVAIIYTAEEDSPTPSPAAPPIAAVDSLKTAETNRMPIEAPASQQPTVAPRSAKPQQTWPRLPRQNSYKQASNKFPAGTVIELNQADTLTLKKIPGIGSTFARRIVGYRELLGGFYTVEQLAEVYGIDEERYNALHTWFKVDTTCIQPLRVNQLSFKELLRHPYLNTSQVRQIERLRRKAPLQSWNDLILLEEFSAIDRQRLRPYLSFE